MNNNKQKNLKLRRWIGTIMCVMGVCSAIFFTYVKFSKLWNTVDEAGNATGQSGALILVVASLLLLAKGIQVLLYKDNHKKKKKINFTLPDL